MDATCPKCGIAVMWVDHLFHPFHIAYSGKNNYLLRDDLYVLKGWAVCKVIAIALQVVWFCVLELVMRCMPGYRTGPKLNYRIREKYDWEELQSNAMQQPFQTDKKRFYVNTETGDDANSGLLSTQPFATLEHALAIRELGDEICFIGEIKCEGWKYSAD